MHHAFDNLFVEVPLLMSYLISGNFVQQALSKNSPRQFLLNMAPSSSEGLIFFHELRVLDDELNLMVLSVKRSCVNANRFGNVVR